MYLQGLEAPEWIRWSWTALSISPYVSVLQRGGQFTINCNALTGGRAAARWGESRGLTPSAAAEVTPQPTCHFSRDMPKLCEGISYLPSGEEKGSIPLLDLSARVDLCMEGSCSAAGRMFKSILSYNNAACGFFLSLFNTQIRLKNK